MDSSKYRSKKDKEAIDEMKKISPNQIQIDSENMPSVNQINESQQLIGIDERKSLYQHKLNLEGIELFFPYQPYSVQIDYMRSVLQALQASSNALLQSPVGTGKKISLLCSILSWINSERKKKQQQSRRMRLIYCLKDISAMNQVISELKSTAYKPKVCFFASREQQCIKKEFSHLKAQDLKIACKKSIQEQSCQYYNYSNQNNRQVPEILREIMDLEDLLKKGTESQCKFCPYYYSREIKEEAEIIIVPSNVFLDKNSFDADFQAILKDSIIVFDDAHNVPSVAEEGFSFKIDSLAIRESQKELQLLISQDSQQIKGQSAEYFHKASNLLQLFLDLFTFYENEAILEQFKDGNTGCVLQIKELFEQIEEIQRIKQSESEQIKQGSVDRNDNTNQSGQEDKSALGVIYGIETIKSISEQLQSILDSIQTIKCQNLIQFNNFISQICMIQQQYQQNQQSNQKFEVKYKLCFFKGQTEELLQSSFNLWCLDPSLIFKTISQANPHSIILTSSTLHPLNSWEAELQISFPIKLTTNHIINLNKTVIGGIVQNGPNGISLNFSSQHKSNLTPLLNELGEFIISLAQVIPNGILVSFCSEQLMTDAQQIWKASSSRIYMRLLNVKDIFFEPKSTIEATKTIQAYVKSSQDSQRGAILFFPYNKKIAQSLSSVNSKNSGVIIVGIPFPLHVDTRIFHKMQYYDKCSEQVATDSKKCLSGREWYFINTVRQINQDIGRVIQHKDEYGSIFLVDARFSQPQFQDHFPSWIKPALSLSTSHQNLLDSTKKFFQEKFSSLTSLEYVLQLGEKRQEIKAQPKELYQKYLKSQAIDENTTSEKTFNYFKLKGGEEQKEEQTSKEDSKLNFLSIFKANQSKFLQGTAEDPKDSEMNIEKQIDKQRRFNNFTSENSLSSQNSSNISSPSSQSIQFLSSFPVKRKIVISEQSQELPLKKFGSNESQINSNYLENSLKPNKAQHLTSKQLQLAQQQSQFEDSSQQGLLPQQNAQTKIQLVEKQKSQMLSDRINSNDSLDSLPQNTDKASETQNNNSKQIKDHQQRKGKSLKVSSFQEEESIPQSLKELFNLRNSAPQQVGEASKQIITPLPEQSKEPKKAVFHKVLLSNTARGLASFNQGDIFKPGRKKKQPTSSQKVTNQITSVSLPQNDKVISQNDNNQTKQDNQDDEDLQTNKDQLCPICYEKYKNNHKSSYCGHQACLECWKQWLKEQLTCPMCRVRCRVAYLEPCQ